MLAAIGVGGHDCVLEPTDDRRAGTNTSCLFSCEGVKDNCGTAKDLVIASCGLACSLTRPPEAGGEAASGRNGGGLLVGSMAGYMSCQVSTRRVALINGLIVDSEWLPGRFGWSIASAEGRNQGLLPSGSASSREVGWSAKFGLCFRWSETDADLRGGYVAGEIRF